MRNKRLLLFILLVLFLYPVTSYSGWTPMPSGTTQQLNSVWGSSSIDVFAVSVAGNILHYNGATWSSMVSSTVQLNDIWGSSGSDVFVVGVAGKILHYNGSFWSSTNPQGNHHGVWGSSSSDVFVVGDFGIILHYNGSSWSPMPSGTIQALRGIWGSSSTDVFVVGEGGTILRYNGSTWSSMPSGTTEFLFGVWGSSGSDVFAVGYYGTILHYDGSSWSPMTSGITEHLIGVWGSSGSDVFAVGSNNNGYGTILHYNGSSWSPMPSGTIQALRGVWGSSSTDVFAVGQRGTILHYGETSTLIGLSSFTATPSNKEVIIEWSTKTEIDNASFNLFRSEAEDGEYIKINGSLIPAQGSSTQGASYEFIDKDVKNRKTYYYKLEDIDLNGTSTMHGPVSATPRWLLGIFSIFKK